MLFVSDQDRFGIPQIGEFYGATEGNAVLLNFCTTLEDRGAVGFQGTLVNKVQGFKVVKFDVEKEEPLRGKDGFCREAAYGEVGELLGPIVASDPLKAFDGYHGNAQATNKKVLKNAFSKGDSYFRTGDLLRYDANGFWHFIDRIGDTFRWKGENVSTNEVAEVVSVIEGVEECNVYGALIQGYDGRACMAAFVPGPNFSPATLATESIKNLPSYAVPLFLRILPMIEITGTFKHQKVALRNQGANPQKCGGDAIFILGTACHYTYMFPVELAPHQPF